MFSHLLFTFRPRHLIWAIALVCLVLAAILIVSPSAQAMVAGIIQTIGGVNYNQTTDFPGDNNPVVIDSAQEMSMAEVLEILPFVPSLPTWIPDGFELQDSVRLWCPSNLDGGLCFARWTWKKRAQQIHLQIEYPRSENESTWIVGPAAAEEVQLADGTIAAFVEGGWNPETKQWDASAGLQLSWYKDGTVYHISTTNAAISKDTIVEMADSIP
jgi:hypothetical protein